MQKVFIVDDDDAVRKALGLLLCSVGLDTESYPSAQDFLAAYHPGDRPQAECLVVDVRMPGMSGLELQDELRARGLDIPVIMLSGYADVPMAVRAMRAGALTFLKKPVNEQELIDCIQDALKRRAPNGGVRTRSNLIEEYRGLLTPRQREVFDLILKGLQTKHIADRLALSPRTVEVHRAKILERLHATTSAELIRQLFEATSER